MSNCCEVPVILTGGGRSPVMPGRDGGPLVCAAGRSGAAARPSGPTPRGGAGAARRVGASCRAPVQVSRSVRPDRCIAPAPQPPTEQGSQTTEYALILIVAATIAMLALTWAKQGAVKTLLDGVIAQVLALFGIGAG